MQRKELTAQYCLNGHPNGFANPTPPTTRQSFCKICGAASLPACPECQADFPFYMQIPPAPPFCHGCGKPLPWTVTALRAAEELTDLQENLSDEEKILLKKSIDDLVRDTPRTTVAAERFKILAGKTGKATLESLRSILVSVASETAKKILFPIL